MSSSLPQPRPTSSLIKASRWTMLGLGLVYGFQRQRILSKKETIRRAKEEEERPAKEAAMKAEKEKRDREEMEYLGRETGVDFGTGAGPGGGGRQGENSKYASDCGCKY